MEFGEQLPSHITFYIPWARPFGLLSSARLNSKSDLWRCGTTRSPPVSRHRMGHSSGSLCQALALTRYSTTEWRRINILHLKTNDVRIQIHVDIWTDAELSKVAPLYDIYTWAHSTTDVSLSWCEAAFSMIFEISVEAIWTVYVHLHLNLFYTGWMCI